MQKVKVMIDYLTLTTKNHDFSLLVKLLGLDQDEVSWIQLPGRYGWVDRYYFSGISILTGGRDDVCLEISGSGCRALEGACPGFDWLGFLREFEDGLTARSPSVSLARLDVAGDDRPGSGEKGMLDLRKMMVHCKHRRYICKARWRIWIDGDEQAIYFGSPKSDRRLRIYNKGLEQGIDEHWVRAEFQLRDANATSFLLNWFRQDDIGGCYGGVLRDFLRFTDRDPAGHSERAKVCPWWSRFLDSVESCPQLYLDGSHYSLMALENFLKKQTASSLKTWLQLHNGDMTDLLDMIEGARLNYRQHQLLAEMQKG